MNRVQVFGSGVYGEELAWSEISGGGDYLTQVFDINLNSADRVNGRGASVKRRWELATTPATLAAPVNCGVELYDVVTVTESRLDLAAAKRRVRGYTVRYRRSAASGSQGAGPRWEMGLDLAGA